MESFTKKTIKFYNISAHGLNYGPDHFFDLPPNVVVIMPSTRQALTSALITDGVIWQMNLLKPDETLQNIKVRIDAYKKNHERYYDKPLDFKVYDSRIKKKISMPNIFYQKDENDSFFSGIVQCPLNIKLMYLKDDDCVLSKEADVLVKQQNIMYNTDSKNRTRLTIPNDFECIKKKKNQVESVSNDEVIIKIEELIQDNLGKYKVLASDFSGENQEISTHENGFNYYKKNEKITNPIISLIYPQMIKQSSKTYIYDNHELITSTTLRAIITKYRESVDDDTVLYFFSFSCNKLAKFDSTMSEIELEEAYIKKDTDGMLIDDYMKEQDKYNIDIIEDQEKQDIHKNISEMSNLNNKDELIKYIQINKLNILRLEQIRDNLNDFLLKQDIIEIINFEKKNDIQYILDELLAVNLNFSINGEFQGMSKKIKDLIKDCTIDKINKITNKIKNDETFLIKDTVIQLLNEKKQNNIIEQLKEIEVRIINTDKSKRKYILPDVFKDINEALNNCSKYDIDVIKANIKNVELINLITQALESKKIEIEEKEKEIKKTETYIDLTLLRLKMIDETFNKNQINNQNLYDKLNTKKNINEIDKIVQQEKNPGIIQYGLTNLKKFVDEIPTYEDLLNIRNKIDTDNTIKFKNLILNYIENKETQFLLMLMADGKFRNKYLKYKKKYINLKKNNTNKQIISD